MANFSHVIALAYRSILLREPDPSGLAHFQAQLASGMSEAQMREGLMRSPEYSQRFPSGGPPPPPPPPGTGTMTPLHVMGNRFFNGSGEVKLLGMIVCCDDPSTPEDEALARGWPLVDAPTLALMADHKLNYTDIRLGPSINRDVFGDGEAPGMDGYLLVGGKYDLTQWNPVFWAAVRAVLTYARTRGIYVNVSLIDFWVLDHDLSPWQASRNVQGFDGGHLSVGRGSPHPIHEAWVRKVIQETAEFENVLYQDGNETFKGAYPVWVEALKEIVADELTRLGKPLRVFGSNSGRYEAVDFLSTHSPDPPEPGGLPIIVNEYAPVPANRVLINAKLAYGTGVYYQYWRGDMPWADTERVLDGLQQITEGGDPVPLPDNCPTLVRWQPNVFNIMDGGFHPVDRPVVGGYVVCDSTPRFSRSGSGRGLPCNAEHNEECGGRPCEDPRGGRWTQVSGPQVTMRVQNPGPQFGYQARFGPLAPGTYTVRVEALEDARDALGKPLTVRPDHARETSWEVV